MMTKYTLIFLMGFLFTESILADEASSPPIGDRLVLQLNNTPYSQRQIETYLLVKSALQASSPESVLITAEKNWPDQLEQFRLDMLIEQEAQRLGSFLPSEPMVLKGEEIFRQRFAKSPQTSQTALRLQIDPKTLQRVITSVLQVEALRRSKQKQSSINADKADAPGASRDVTWLEELGNRALVRYYKDAKIYVPSQFTAN